MLKKQTLGIIPIVKFNHNKEEIRAIHKLYKEIFGAADDIQLLIEDEILINESDVIDCVKKMEANQADMIVFIVGSWIYSSVLISAANDIHVPFVLYGLSDQLANGDLGASIQVKYVLQELKKDFLYIYGPIRDGNNIVIIRKYLKAAWIKSTLRNKKIAIIGGKCMMMYQTQVNEFSWKKTFGVDFPHYDTLQIYKEMENVDEKEAKEVAKKFLTEVDEVNWEAGDDKIADDAIISQSKMYLAFKRMKELYDIDVFANKCHPEMASTVFGYGYAGCLATCMLNEEGIMTACEADVPAALSMYILNLLSGQPAFFADIARANKKEETVTFFNCGTAPISMADKKKGVELWPIPGGISDEAVPPEYYTATTKGACIHFSLENEKEVTIMRIGGNDDTLRMHVAKAYTCEREVDEDDVLGHRWPGFGLNFSGGLDSFINNTTGHHYSLIFGDWKRELEYLARILEIKFVYDE